MAPTADRMAMEMQDRLMFVIGSPRSGSTLLARMLGSHSQIYGRPEPHMLTPLAHLGYYAKVDKAPYDAVLAAESIRQFVDDLPGGEQDYIDACRAYTDTLYHRMLETEPGKRIFLDKTPAYALVLDFISTIYPDARYVVLTRHPLAIFSSYAESFFDGDYSAAHAYNPIIERYVPAIAKFLRENRVPMLHLLYEDLVTDPEKELARAFDFLGLPNEAEAVDYGKHEHLQKGLGDPIGVARHSRPSTESLHKWAAELAAEPAREKLCREIIARLDPADLEIWGHPFDEIWKPLDRLEGRGVKSRRRKWDRYSVERRAIVLLRKRVSRHPSLRRVLSTLRLGLDVLLRE
ncbi:MAG: sulfotransferase [Candidatus Binatia bacterium]